MLQRGLRGAMVGAGLAAIVAVAVTCLLFFFQIAVLDARDETDIREDIRRLGETLPRAALAGAAVGLVGGLASKLPDNGVSLLTSISVVAAFAVLGRLSVVIQPRYVGTPEPSYLSTIIAASLGSVLVLAYGILARRSSAANE